MDDQGIDLCMDEAKTMAEINSYHDHIVNLQGVTFVWDSMKVQFSEVKKIVQLLQY